MSGFLSLPHPYPQIAEILAFDNDELAEFYLRLALVRGLDLLGKNLALLCPPCKVKDYRSAEELVKLELAGLASQVEEMAAIAAAMVEEEPPF